MASNAELGPAHLVVALLDRQRGDIATGTAKSQGISLAKARRAAGIAHQRRLIADGATPAANRARKVGPLVLLGGGETSPEVFSYAIDLGRARRGAARRLVNVACIFASGPGRSDQARERRLRHFRLADDVVAEDCGLDDRRDASRPGVLAALAETDVIFMDRGKAERLYDTLVATPAMEAITDASGTGAVVMGLSAGAAIWGGRLHERLGVGRPPGTLPPLELAGGHRRPAPLCSGRRGIPPPANRRSLGLGWRWSGSRRGGRRAAWLGTVAHYLSRSRPLRPS